jgi:hypothetical protein
VQTRISSVKDKAYDQRTLFLHYNYRLRLSSTLPFSSFILRHIIALLYLSYGGKNKHQRVSGAENSRSKTNLFPNKSARCKPRSQAKIVNPQISRPS